MSEGLKLEELEAYRVELNNAQREGRPCKYRNPRDVFAEDLNRDSYLVEKDEEVIAEEQKALESQAANTTYLSDPGQAVAEEAAKLGAADHSVHQNAQEVPNPDLNTTADQETLEDSKAGETSADQETFTQGGNFPPGAETQPEVPTETPTAS